jgi:hypothetical protein
MTLRNFFRTPEGRAVLRHHANLLLVSPARLHERVADVLTRYLPKPVHCLTHWPVESPQEGTVIIPAIEQFSRDDQLGMLSWFEHRQRIVQVIAVTAVPLLNRVLKGDFIDDLYYRMNTIYAPLDPIHAPAV